jgi:hypothetical protein
VAQLPVCFALESQLSGPATPERMQTSELFGLDREGLSSATHQPRCQEPLARSLRDLSVSALPRA